MEGLYSSAISGIQTILSHRVDNIKEQKDAAIKALEEEKEAAMDAIQAEIDAKQDEIDAIREANDERSRELDLMQKKYELEKLMNQNSRLVYKEGQGMVYEQDNAGIRDARNAVDEAEDNIKIAEIEKEIEALEDELKAVEEYYDDLIKKTEEMFDAQISQLEKLIAKWAELAAIKELAEAWEAIGMTAEDLGYTIEDLLNGNEHAFEDFKARYLGILSDMNAGSEYYQQGLEVFGNTSISQMDHITDSFQTAVNTMSSTLSNADFSTIATGLEEAGATIIDNAEKIGVDVTAGIGKGMGEETASLTEGATLVGDNTEDALRTSLQTHSASERTKPIGKDVVDGVRDGMIENAGDVQEGADAVGAAVETALNDSFANIGESVDTLNNLNIDTENISAAAAAFNELGSAIQSASDALSGGGIGGGEADATGGATAGMATEAMGGAGGGIVSAISSIKTATDEALGGGDSEEGAIGAFTKLGETIMADTTAINGGGGESGEGEGGKSGSGKKSCGQGEGGEGEGGGSDLCSAINDLGSTTEEIVGTEMSEEGGTVIGDFGLLDTVVAKASEHVNKIRTDLEEMQGKTYEVHVRIIIEGAGVGSAVGRAAGSALGAVNKGLAGTGRVARAEIDYGGIPDWIVKGGNKEHKYEAHYGRALAEGTAKATGDWRVHRGGKTLVGELGPEIVIRDGKYFTVGDNGAEFVNLHPDDIVLNHKQSREVLSGKNQVSHAEVERKMNDKAFQKAVSKKMAMSGFNGRALATGTAGNLRPLTADESAIFNIMAGIRTDLTTSLIPDISDIKGTIKTISNVKSINSSPVINMNNVFECNGVTVDQVRTEIASSFTGLIQNAYQRVMIK